MRKTTALLFFIFLSVAATPVAAQLSSVQNEWWGTIDEQTSKNGVTLSIDERALTFGILPGALPGATRASLRKQAEQERAPSILPPPDGMRYMSGLYYYDFPDIVSLKKNFLLALESKPVTHRHGVYLYDTRSSAWFPLETAHVNSRYFRAETDSLSGYVAVFEYESADAEFLALVETAAAVSAEDGTDRTIVSRHSRDTLPVASLTKLMTALVFLDRNPGWDNRVTITAADDAAPAKLSVVAGDILTVRSLFQSMLIGSKNNAAKALARTTGVSEKNFVKAMNAKAHAFGMADTRFVDVTGLSPANTSTATDMTRLVRAAFQNPTIRAETSKRSAAVKLLNRRKTLTVTSTNDLVLEGMKVAGKTGYIPEAGYNLAVYQQNKKEELYVVILGASTSRDRFALAKALLNRSWQ